MRSVITSCSVSKIRKYKYGFSGFQSSGFSISYSKTPLSEISFEAIISPFALESVAFAKVPLLFKNLTSTVTIAFASMYEVFTK